MQEQELLELLKTCEEEPIETPGTTQSHGSLVVWDRSTKLIVAASANLEAFLGVKHEDVLGTHKREVLPEEVHDALDDGLSESSQVNPIPFVTRHGLRKNCILSVRGDLGFAEFESHEERSGLSRNHAPFDEYIQLLYSSQINTSGLKDLDLASYLDDCSKHLKEFTGFDRVLVYRFLPDGSGEVVAEAKNDDLEPFINLRYPSSDIPRRARDLYKSNLLRVISDIEQEPVPLITRGMRADEVDLSTCSLRSPSSVHVQYLANMGVRATMVISIMQGYDLWGLIACHHYAPKTVPYMTRATSQLYTSNIAAHISMIENLSFERHVAQSRRCLHGIVENLSSEQQLVHALQTHLEELLPIFDSDGVTLIHDELVVSSGTYPAESEAEHVVDILDTADQNECVVETAFLRDSAAGDGKSIAGYMGIRLTSDLHLIFWRREEQETINWAGRPDKTEVVDVDGMMRLRPRGSFAIWTETHRGTSKPWDQMHIELLEEFRTSFSKLLLDQNYRLEKLNDELRSRNLEMEAFAYSVSHDLKTPLVTLTSFLGLIDDDLDEGNLDDVRDSVSRMRRAASRMSQLIDDMLELSRIGSEATNVKELKLRSLTEPIIDSIDSLLQKHESTVRIVEPDLKFSGNFSSISRMLENLITNAVKYGCDKPGMQVRVGGKRLKRHTLLYVEDDGPGIETEYQERVFRLFERMNTNQGGSGIGLSIVEKVANSHGGSVELISQPGEGARFEIRLPHHRPSV